MCAWVLYARVLSPMAFARARFRSRARVFRSGRRDPLTSGIYRAGSECVYVEDIEGYLSVIEGYG